MSDKTCKNCSRELPYTAFNKKRSTKDGYNNYCRTCVNSKSVVVDKKTCQICKEEKPATDFHKMKSSEDGLHPYCKPCKKDYAAKLYDEDKERILMVKAEWRNTRAEYDAEVARAHRAGRRQYLWEVKSVPCKDCGDTFDPVCMDFDHLPEYEKLFTIGDGSFASVSMEVLVAEIAKCDIICANCHRLRTRDRRL